MDNNNQEIKYVATFHNHYGALLFKKKMGECCILKPVPRTLSSSCGTAAFFSLPFSQDYVSEYLEGVYIAEDGRYRRIYGEE